MELKSVDRTNYKEAIRIQNSIFPHENGALNILASLDRDLFIKVSGLAYPDHRVRYWLADTGGTAAGISGLYHYGGEPDDVWLGWFGILAEYRQRGYGRELLELTMRKAASEGFRCLRLYTDYRDNHDAVRLYEALGFAGEKYTAEELPYDCRIYSKHLCGGEAIPWDNRYLDLSRQAELELTDPDRIIRLYDSHFG